MGYKYRIMTILFLVFIVWALCACACLVFNYVLHVRKDDYDD